ncbi:hypothetical protein KUTeg_022354 [Tegillarca granosa]|uniref:Uncharacterized protein n=1 Tax=Tegillarca granosa TaxID=220873 RepID=A0ABQ9EBE9_TEGGR|nr:hypothetical protein KUTeg_022354 [Tegillarca granosa]
MYGSDSTTLMRYKYETPFAFGELATSSSKENSPDHFNPELSDVNFVIPSRQNLMDKSESVQSLMPSLIPETISNLSSVMRGRVTKLAIDGKKVQGVGVRP